VGITAVPILRGPLFAASVAHDYFFTGDRTVIAIVAVMFLAMAVNDLATLWRNHRRETP
jgi:hypothetical protein